MDVLNDVLNSDIISLKNRIISKGGKNVKTTDFSIGLCGESPLHIAVYKRDSSMLQIMLDEGASPTLHNHIGDTPMHTCARIGYFDAAVILYNTNKSLLDLKNKEGLTATDIAKRQVLDSELDLTRIYAHWDGKKDGSLEYERECIIAGRKKLCIYLEERLQHDIQVRQQNAIHLNIIDASNRNKASKIMRNTGYANERIYAAISAPSNALSECYVLSSEIRDYVPRVTFTPVETLDISKSIIARDLTDKVIQSSVEVVNLKKRYSVSDADKMHRLSSDTPQSIYTTRLV